MKKIYHLEHPNFLATNYNFWLLYFFFSASDLISLLFWNEKSVEVRDVFSLSLEKHYVDTPVVIFLAPDHWVLVFFSLFHLVPRNTLVHSFYLLPDHLFCLISFGLCCFCLFLHPMFAASFCIVSLGFNHLYLGI